MGIIGLAPLPELQEGRRLGHHLAEQGFTAELGVPSEGDAPDLRQRYCGWNLCLPSAYERTGRAEKEQQARQEKCPHPPHAADSPHVTQESHASAPRASSAIPPIDSLLRHHPSLDEPSQATDHNPLTESSERSLLSPSEGRAGSCRRRE